MSRVVYSCPYVPAEWIAAHGLRPSRIRPRAADGPGVCPTAGVCPYVRAFADAVCDTEDVQAVIVTTTCDQMRRVAELITRHSERPVFTMHVPTTWQTPAACRLYVDELKRLGRFLATLGGRAPARQQLAEWILRYEDQRAALRDARAVLSAAEHSQAIADLNSRGEWDRPADRAPLCLRGPAVALVGGPLMEGDTALLEAAEALGAAVVLDATESGEPSLPPPVDRRDVRDNPFLAMAEAYFGGIPHVFRRPNSQLYEYLKREIAARDVRGVICRYYLWCDKWHAEVHRIEDCLGVPVLDLQAAGGEDAARLAARIGSFLEVLP